MEYIESMLKAFQNAMLLAALTAWGTAEIIKMLIRFLTGKRGLSELWGSGGMPSAHSATVSALAMSVGFRYGFDGALFAIAAVLTLVVMYDASGVRREAGKHAVALNALKESQASKEEEAHKKHKESIGHTKPQVIAGATWGVIVAMLFYFIR